jgi:hypothetical protein
MLLLILLMLPAILSVGLGWLWSVASAEEENRGPTWRCILGSYALIAASLGLVLNFAFLGHGYTSPRSFLGPPAGLWLIVGRTNGAIWLVSLVSAVVGKGRVRLPLFFYFLTSVGANFLFMTWSTID